MNTQLTLNRKAALAACILATAIWLPLATQAQDLTKSADPMPGMHIGMGNGTHHYAKSGSTDVRNCWHSHHSLASGPANGYGNAEADAGFAETDPASSPYQPDMDMQNQHRMTCQHESGERMVHTMPMSQGMMGKRYSADQR